MELIIPTPKVFEPLLAEARYKGAHGGRGSGKSHFFAELLIEESICSKVDAVCIREIQKSLDQSVKKLLEHKIEQMNVGAYFEVLDSVIRSKRGGRIIFQGMQNHTADSIKSLEGYDRAWVEEAQSLSQRSLDLLRPTIRKDGSQIWFSWNPSDESDPVDAFLRGDNAPKDAIVVEANHTHNPFFPEVLKAEMEFDRQRDFEKYLHVWEGAYKKQSEALVFRNWRVQEFDTPKDAVLRFGADWGFAADPTVLVRCFIEGRKLFIDYEAYLVGCEIMDTPALFMTVPESEKYAITADSARPETISHMRKNGFPKIMQAAKGSGSVEEGIEWLKSFDIIIHPRCIHVADEFKRYSYKVDKLTQKVLPVLEDKNNHTIDAVRYACEGARRAMVKSTVKQFAAMPTVSYFR